MKHGISYRKLLQSGLHVLMFALMMAWMPTWTWAQQNVPSRVIALDGHPYIRRGGWSNANAAVALVLGDSIYEDDLVVLSINDRVTVQCPDMNTVILSVIPQTVHCPTSSSNVITFDNTPIVNVQRAPLIVIYRQVAYLTSPRNTMLLDDMPPLRWNDLPDALSYRIRILNEAGESVFQANSSHNYLDAPFNQPLVAGVYQVTITPLDDQNAPINTPSDPGSPSQPNTVWFEIPDADHIKAIQDGAALVQADSLPEGSPEGLANYNLALYYASNGVYDEAIKLLQALLPAGTEAGSTLPAELDLTSMAGSPVLYMTLGDIYRQVGLPIEAWHVYETGLQVAERVQNTANAAYLQVQLARLIPDKDQAVALYQDAIAFYQQVGDSATTAILQREIDNYQ